MIEAIIMALAMFGAVSVDRSETLCLAQAVYHEARGEPLAGRFAVAHVVRNRTPPQGRICTTVFARGQFSGSARYRPPAALSREWVDAAFIAAAVLSGASADNTGGATFFHGAHIRPAWVAETVMTRRIGSHVFRRQR